MLEITPFSNPSGNPAAHIQRSGVADERAKSQPPEQRAASADRVELSAAAESFKPEPVESNEPDERVQEIRARIADGTYLTDDKIDEVVERLFDEVFGDSTGSA